MCVTWWVVVAGKAWSSRYFRPLSGGCRAISTWQIGESGRAEEGERRRAVLDEMLAKADIGRFENRAAGQRSYKIRRMMLISVVV
jgi:hypothetical protein